MKYAKLLNGCTVIGQCARLTPRGHKWSPPQVLQLLVVTDATGESTRLEVQGEPGMVFDPRVDEEDGVLGNESGALFKLLEIVRTSENLPKSQPRKKP